MSDSNKNSEDNFFQEYWRKGQFEQGFKLGLIVGSSVTFAVCMLVAGYYFVFMT